MQKIAPFLWFNNQAEEAMNFYTSIFKNSHIKNVSHYGEEAAKVAGVSPGAVMTGTIELEGQEFMVINGGPDFHFTPAISFFVRCDSQEEVDELWDKLSSGGETQKCGWLQDRFGLSWQIIPTILGELLNDPDPQKTQRVMQAMLQMEKIEIDGLKKAYEQE